MNLISLLRFAGLERKHLSRHQLFVHRDAGNFADDKKVSYDIS